VGPSKDVGRDAALGVARANGEVEFPDGDTFAPTQIRVTVRDPAMSGAGGHHHEAAIKAQAEAELAPPVQIGLPLTGGDGEYRGPFAYRQGKPMRSLFSTRSSCKPRLIRRSRSPISRSVPGQDGAGRRPGDGGR
jgi:hypothetical protein